MKDALVALKPPNSCPRLTPNSRRGRLTPSAWLAVAMRVAFVAIKL